MKKLFLILMLAIVAMAGMAQSIGDAFYIYRNDGQFNAFFRAEVDSIVYSNYDADSVYYDEIVTQLVYTADSIYRIPLAAIDSVGFVRPETIYKEDAVPLTGGLFDYLISADSLSLAFDQSIPLALLPKIGDKLVTMELTEKIPCGFAGKVKGIENEGDVITVYCDSLAFEDAVSRFYGVVEIVSQSQGDNEARRYLPSKAPVATYTYPFYPNIPDFNLPISLEGVINPQKVYRSIEGKASANMHITPTLTGRAVYVIDNLVVPTHYEMHVVVDIKTESTLDIAGVANGDFVKWWQDRDVPMPWGYPLYLAVGPMLEIEGDVALGFKVRADVRHIEDITYYPFASLTPLTQMMFNTVDQSTQITRFDVDWQYFALRGSAKVGFRARVGLPVPKHEVAWFGGEFQLGERVDAELNVDFDAIEKAETGTAFYDALKSNSSLSEMSYGGAQFCVMGWGDRLKLKFGRDDYSFGGKRYSGDFLPIFSDTKAEICNKSETSAKVSANITNDCLIPYTVGFSLFDENGNRIGDPQWNEQKFWRRNGFTLPYEATFTDLATEKKYKAYPTLRLFGFNVLASPSADLDMHFPVTLSDFKVTKRQYRKGSFTNDGKKYDYRFDVSVTATLDGDATDVTDWGYVYLDENGREAFLSLMEFGKTYTDTRYAYYRNEPKSTCTLYGYVKYEGSDEPVYGAPHDYPLEYGNTSCPDSNHPHWIDLGLPSGTMWACCNVGASTPEGYGGYYSWGEVNEKNEYFETNYLHVQGHYDDGNWSRDYFIDIGSNISGTQYDVAHVRWGGGWHMPTKEQCDEVYLFCIEQGIVLNGVKGRSYTGPNGGKIFLPNAGYRGGVSSIDVGRYIYYWTSNNYDPDPGLSHYARIFSPRNIGGGATTATTHALRVEGLPVRPVR